MGRSRGQRTRDKNKATLPQVTKNLKSDGLDVEYSREFADHEDLEAEARAQTAGIRQSKNRNQ
ncbi:YfhD family protein [Bacillus alveayuensis]|uniref:YfhD family protein n=1 Tax=Aeribacillus alveayuensis TaxID=279215 RepID=UPI0005D108AA|nr:YfhD family protein [Bacillus alveayuensis]